MPRFIAPNHTGTPRLVEMVEAAYRLDGDLNDWIERVLVCAEELDHGLGVFGFLQKIAHAGVEHHGIVVAGTPADLERIAMAREGLTDHSGHVSFASSPLMRSGSYRAQVARAGLPTEPFDAHFGRCGMADLLGISTNLGGGLVFSVVAPTPTVYVERPATIERYQRLAAHLGAGLRLRSHLAAPEVIPDLVFRPDGRLVHAEKGVSIPHIERARKGVAASEHARSDSMRRAPDEALSLWQGLVSGRWSLVDRQDTRRRYIVAYRNELDIPRPPTVTPREASVVRFIAGGASLKEVAYALGVTTSTVHDALTRAMKKLRVSHRSELAQVWQSAQATPESDIVKVPLSPGESIANLSRLTPAEREVVNLVARGLSSAAIAKERGTSVHTVSNQLSTLYEKLGVRSKAELTALLSGAFIAQGRA